MPIGQNDQELETWNRSVDESRYSSSAVDCGTPCSETCSVQAGGRPALLVLDGRVTRRSSRLSDCGGYWCYRQQQLLDAAAVCRC